MPVFMLLDRMIGIIMAKANNTDGDVIFTKTIRLRNGKVIHAAAYGLQAFRIVVKNKRKK